MTVKVKTSYLYTGDERTTDFVSDAYQTTGYTKAIQQTHTATKNQLADISPIHKAIQRTGLTR